EIVKVLFTLAQFELDHGNDDVAAARFLLIVTKYPAAREAGPAGDRMLQILAKQRKYAALAELAKTLATHLAFRSKDRQVALARVRVEALAKQADTDAAAGRYADAAAQLLRAAGEADARAAAQYTLNAGVMFEKARKWDEAIGAYVS